ncbi:sugar phosphate isomerase/epimerase family protein [Lacipirellula sp.]|uniref:sugar phosphate isomerase/epimerase family protein n=1 Tax=Lacipirellula sp. TaxID=2691419 RepID=UPI003D0DD0F4
MKTPSFQPRRREFLAAAAAIGSAAYLCGNATAADRASEPAKQAIQFCAFEKFLQDLSHDELADGLAELGFNGVEVTARQGGRITPERAQEQLPALVDALAKRNLEVTILTTEVNRADDPTNEKLLAAAAKLGIKRYRLGWFKYADDRPIPAQLAGYRSQLLDLAALNRELGITGLWQNHSGEQYVGATIWDLHQLLQDVPKEEVAAAFDIRHATVEAGRSWPRLYQLIKPHIGALYMKDFAWSGNRDKHITFGKGRVEPRYFEMLKHDRLEAPVSIHVEYLPRGSAQENLQAIGRDFNRVRELLQTASDQS